tara:strand:+ start:1512 stop:3335 length:1824 start_codon:yes stop_codon:yes gene_type:complete
MVKNNKAETLKKGKYLKFKERRINPFFELKEIYKYLTFKRKIQLLFLFASSILTSLAEFISLASFYPFLTILTNPKILKEINLINNYIQFFNIQNDQLLLIHITSIFCIAVIFAAIVRLSNLWLGLKLSALIGNDISKLAYRKTLYQKYEVHINRNTSEYIAALTNEIDATTNSLNALLQGITSLLIFLSLLSFILFVNWRISLIAALIFGSIYFLMGKSLNNLLRKNSKIQVDSNKLIIKEIREALISIREVILDGTQELYLHYFGKVDKRLKISLAKTNFIAIFPRFSVEAVALVTISLIAFTLAKDPINKSNLFPVLGALALGSQRLLPALQQVYTNWTVIKGYEKSVSIVLDLLSQPFENYSSNKNSRNHYKKLVLKDISFSYEGSNEKVLEKIDLEIFKGEKIGIVGESGSGKSTLLDIIMGLLPPTKGQILLDDKDIYNPSNQDVLHSWRNNLSHVPQNIFLADSTFVQNIALGVPFDEINFKQIKYAAEKAQISKFINSNKKRYNTTIGEDGIKISGGQRQRIAIARALYKDSDFLILDEATSALDLKTERDFMNSVNILSKKMTLIIVAHRLSTLKNCDRIIRISKGRIYEIGKPKDFI